MIWRKIRNRMKIFRPEYPDIAQKIDEIMTREHTPSDVWPSPGEAQEEFEQRMLELGITPDDRPKNVADF